MMGKEIKEVRALIPYGEGLNCDHETKYIFELAGAKADMVHVRDIESKNVKLNDYHILCFIGGFHAGDENGGAVKWAYDTRRFIYDELLEFVHKDKKLVMGICNGFQNLANLGLLPGFDGQDGRRVISVSYNDCGNFRNQWVKLKVNQDSPCIYTKGMNTIDFPIRHGEGKVIPGEQVLEKLVEGNQIVMQYSIRQTGEPANMHFPDNPNGSVDDIAGICDPTGRVFGLMPHPEAFNHWTNHDQWTRKKYHLSKNKETIKSTQGYGVKIFQNAVQYAKEHLI